MAVILGSKFIIPDTLYLFWVRSKKENIISPGEMQKKHRRLKHFLKLHAEWGKDNERQIGKAEHNDPGCCQYMVTSHTYNMVFGDFE